MAENKKREQLLKGNRRNHKEINRRNPLHMIANKGLPGLQWPIWSGHHIDRNRGLGDLDAELEQLAMDLGGARLCRSAVGLRANGTSIASKRQSPFGANAQPSPASRWL